MNTKNFNQNKIENIETLFNKLQTEIKQKKVEIKFDELVKEYLKLQEELKKLIETEVITKEIKQQIFDLKNQKQNQLKVLKQIEFTERKILPLKKHLENLISLIEKNKKQFEYFITKTEIKKSKLELLINNQEILDQKKQLKILEQELLNINKNILEQKNKKQSFIVLNYSKSKKIKEIKKIKNFLNKANKVNLENIKQNIIEFQELIDIKNLLIKEEINNLVLTKNLIVKMDLLISFWNKENVNSKIDLTSKYFNNNIKRIKDSFDKLQIEINQKKEEIGFTKLLKEYSKTKYELKKLRKRKIINKEVEQKIIEFEKIKQNQLKLLKPIEVVEIKIFHLKKQLENIIFVIDRKKNQFEYFVANTEVRKNELKLLINDQEISDQRKNLKNLDQELFKINTNILKLKVDKKPILAFNYSKMQKIKEINKVIIFLKKVDQTNLEKVKQNLLKSQKLIDMRTPIIEGEINNLALAQKLITQMDASISFGSEEDIDPNLAFSIKYLNIFYGYKQALFDINIDIPKTGVTAIIGPSGCGKSTFIRTLNRINDQIPDFRVKGKILFDGEYNIYKLRSVINRYDKLDISTLRTKVGMIFQQPNPFPMSIYKNVTYGPKIRGIKNKAILNDIVVKSLKDAGLYEEVKDNLKVLGTSLSGGQQQRLCIARAIANQPEVLLMDEPTSALDPIAAKIVEDLIHKLKEDYTIIVVTHSMQQAKRLSDRTAFFYEGRLIEYGETKELFKNPKEEETRAYISGKFG